MTIAVRSASAMSSARLQGVLGLAVEVGRGLVEHEEARALEQEPCDGEALLLAAGEAVPAVTDHGVQAGGQGLHERQHLRGAERVEHLGLGGARGGIGEVGTDRVVEEVRLLGDDPDRVVNRLQRGVTQVHPVDPHGAAGGVVEAGDEGCERRLAGTAGPDEGHELTWARPRS